MSMVRLGRMARLALMAPMALMVTMVVVTVTSAVAEAQEREARAKVLYEQGKLAYERADYPAAYEAFREAFDLSQRPALLYNVASALQGLRRPHDAANALRSYLR